MRTKNKRNLTDKEIIRLLREHNDVLRKHRVKKIGLFGSYIRGGQKRRSDIDFLVEFDMSTFDMDFTGYFDNFMDLQFALKKMLGRKIDLLTEGSISPYIKPYIISVLFLGRYIERPLRKIKSLRALLLLYLRFVTPNKSVNTQYPSYLRNGLRLTSTLKTNKITKILKRIDG